MQIKTKLSIVALFSCCAVFSMGFANWAIAQQQPSIGYTSGGIAADDIIVSDEYIYIEKPENIKPFIYTPYGFQADDGTCSYNGIFLVTFTVDLLKCEDLHRSEITLEITFRYNNLPENSPNIFGTTFLTAESNSNELLTDFKTSENSAAGYTALATLNISQAQTSTFTVSYNFSLEETSYNTYIYNVFNDDSKENHYSGVEFVIDVIIKV